MTPRWMRISFFVFGLTWLTLGTLTLVKGEPALGGPQLVLGIGWLLIAVFNYGRSASHSKSERDAA
jgi:hypothetical protein